MNMKKIPWWSPEIGSAEKKLVKKVLESNFPNEGILTAEFERKVSEILKVKYVLAVNNATSAMFLSLKALGIGPGDEVIVPDISFIATANAVEMTGAKAVLVDVKSDSLTIDPLKIEKAISKRTKAIIPVHVSGRAADLEEILKLAKSKNLYVVEDAAEAFTSMYKGKKLGTLGDTGCFSLSPAKTITTGQGGLVVTSNKALYLRLKELKDQGRKKRGTGGNDIHYSLGFNFKFTDIQAAVGLGQLSQLKYRIERMKRNQNIYTQELKNVPQVKLFEVKINSGELQQWTDALVEKREELVRYLASNNIDCRPFWYPIHTQNYYKMNDKNFPVSTALSKKALWLPSSFSMRDSHVGYVCKMIKKFYSE